MIPIENDPVVEDSHLVQHAKLELDLAGLFDEDSDYDGMLGEAVLQLVKVFAGQDHSGFSAAMTADLLARLLRYENLTPISNDPDFWVDVSYEDGVTLHQSKRLPNAFSNDGGQTYYVLSDNPRVIYEAVKKEIDE